MKMSFQQHSCLRTVSDMFDVETFASVMFCLAYLYVFIVILYKFFS